MNEERIAFAEWLHRNRGHLRSYAPNEIAQLALTCGFNLEIVCGPICDTVAFVGRLMRFWESDLADLWMRAREHETGHDQWD